MYQHSKSALAGLGMIAGLALAAPAQAGFTPIGPSSGPEQTIFQILDTLYGAGNYTRLDDNDDNIWPIPTTARASVNVEFNVRWAADEGQFGFFRNGDTYIPLFNLVGGLPSTSSTAAGSYVQNPDGSFTVPFADFVSDLTSGTFEWAYLNRSQNILYSSNAPDNSGVDSFQLDHMITFQLVSDNPNTFVYALAFEDRVLWDYDYNDAVVEIRLTVAGPGSSAVPEPATLSLVGAALMGFAVVRRRQQHRA